MSSKIASVEKISKVSKHPNADLLDIVKVLGYNLVTRKDLYKEGDIAIYIQPDNILPEEPWADDFRKYSPKRIKACKLRGEWSEGILVSKELIPEYEHLFTEEKIGMDVSEILGVVHYEPPSPQNLQAKTSILPFQTPKTDEERWENIENKLPYGEVVDVTLKIDGSSVTYYYDLDSDTFGVCSRSMELKLDCENNYTKVIPIYNIEEKLKNFCKEIGKSLMLRGEVYGNGINQHKNNSDARNPLSLAIYNVWSISERKYFSPESELYFENVCKKLEIPHVPILEKSVTLTPELVQKYSVDMKNLNGKPFEGVVVKHSKGSFKIINKDYDSRK